MSNIGSALRKWREDQGYSTRQLARMVGTTRQSIENLESGKVKRPDYVVALARVIGADVTALAAGRVVLTRAPGGIPPKGESAAYQQVTESATHYNAVALAPGLAIVPLVKHAPLQLAPEFLPLPPDCIERHVTTAADVGGHGFAVRLHNDSMVNPGSGPSYPAGTVIIARADRQPRPGQIVVVHVAGSAELLVKRLAVDGEAFLLEPLNPRYPMLPMPANARIVGVAIKAEIDVP